MAKRYARTPSQVLRTEPGDLAIDMAVALRAERLELEAKTGPYWYLALGEMLFGKADKTDDTDVTWFN